MNLFSVLANKKEKQGKNKNKLKNLENNFTKIMWNNVKFIKCLKEIMIY
jgi:hypothetical protein